MNFLGLGIKLKYIMYIIAVISIGVLVYRFHYYPIKKLTNELQTCSENINNKNIQLQNKDQELQKCQDNLKNLNFQIQLYQDQQNFLNEIFDTNDTVKDTSNEGYLIF